MSRNEDGQRGERDDPTEELFVLPPGEFVAARNRIAAELKKAGNKEAAAAVKALAKPSASVWAVNQVARREPSAMKGFLEISDELRRAQTRGGGSDERRAFQSAQAAQREALEQVLALAEAALRSAKVGSSRAVLDRVANNLRWGALSDDSRALLARGRLAHDVGPPDFSALLGQIPEQKQQEQKEQKEPKAEKDRARHDEPERRREREAAAARERARFLRAALAAAHSKEARARSSENRTRAARQKAERALEAARKELARLERDAAEAAREHAEAEEAVTTHTAEIDRLTRELAEVEGE